MKFTLVSAFCLLFVAASPLERRTCGIVISMSLCQLKLGGHSVASNSNSNSNANANKNSNSNTNNNSNSNSNTNVNVNKGGNAGGCTNCSSGSSKNY
ncbi:hypothetical protein DSO57_1028560 [Entomophthora muscae]|uniref:Uncharacterized protein n=1 Tax=Entomophthora muscae TaxID=34485 RepID=A0ACC2UNG4_9FUNG|nr:hypothetical protein DSO57_1028560 [Entomophthora muscae]